MAYGMAQLQVAVTGGEAVTPRLRTAKIATAACLPVPLYFLAERIAEQPRRWRRATAVWLGLGLTAVAITNGFGQRISETSSRRWSMRVWPTDQSDRALAEVERAGEAFVVGWSPLNIVMAEVFTVAVMAVAAGMALRITTRSTPLVSAVVTATSAVAVLGAYAALTPWAYHTVAGDWTEPWVGDSLLGATFVELAFFPMSWDAVAGVALGVASVSMAGLLVAWGGPLPVAVHARNRPQLAPARSGPDLGQELVIARHRIDELERELQRRSS